MTRAPLFFLLLAASFVTAAPLPQLPPPAYADTEVTTNCPIARCNRETAHFDVSLSFAATPSNNVEVAFGVDENQDGVLDASETDFSLGWDCGEWFVASPQTGFRAAESSASGDMSLAFTMALAPGSRPKSLSIQNGGTALFAPLTEAIPAWMFQPDWNLMSLTARGVDSPDEHFEVRFAPDGILILFR